MDDRFTTTTTSTAYGGTARSKWRRSCLLVSTRRLGGHDRDLADQRLSRKQLSLPKWISPQNYRSFVDKREDHRRFFRLTYGGAYGTPEEDAANLLQYLDGYERWRAEREASLTGSTLMHNMGIDRAELILRPGAKPTIVEGTDEGVRWWQTVVSALEGT